MELRTNRMLANRLEDVKGIHGLTCVPDYISAAEERDLLELIDRNRWSSEFKRRVQHYGYRYDYRRRNVPESGYLGMLPGWLQALAERLQYDGLIAETPDQCVINEYLPGQGIATHVDSIPCFGDTVLALSLGSFCVMEFSHTACSLKLPVLLQPRSLLVMTGQARYKWRHGIPARKSDRYEGMVFPRSRRVSITFRKALVDMAVAALELKYA